MARTNVVVEAQVHYWTPNGMSQSPCLVRGVAATAYVERSEVERLLADAHEQGWRNAINAAGAVLMSREAMFR